MHTEMEFGFNYWKKVFQVKLLRFYKSMYLSVKSCVRVNGSLSDFLTVIWVLNKGNLYPLCYLCFS